MEVRAKVKGWGRTLMALPAAQEPRTGSAARGAFPLGNILGPANPVGGVQGTPLTRKSCRLDGSRGRPRSADASGPAAVLRLHPLSSGEPWGSGKGSCRSVSILWPCCPEVLDFGDQGRGKGIFFRKELGMGVCQGRGLFRGEPGMEEEGSAFFLPS